MTQVSSERFHATTVVREGRAVMLLGPSGSGKSDLALRLIDRGFILVSDDQTLVGRDGKNLVASPPPSIAGKMEVRGLGILEMAYAAEQRVCLFVDLAERPERLPEKEETRTLLGIEIPKIALDAHAASAAAKVELALDRLGLGL